jgi:hypothetical protein
MTSLAEAADVLRLSQSLRTPIGPTTAKEQASRIRAASQLTSSIKDLVRAYYLMDYIKNATTKGQEDR